MYYIKRKNTNLFDEMASLLSEPFKTRTMKTDIIENENSYLFMIDMPGAIKENISISIEDEYLIIKYENKDEIDNNLNYIQKERTYESSTRSFYIGDVLESDIKAKLDNGILNIYVPKKLKEVNSKKTISIE